MLMSVKQAPHKGDWSVERRGAKDTEICMRCGVRRVVCEQGRRCSNPGLEMKKAPSVRQWALGSSTARTDSSKQLALCKTQALHLQVSVKLCGAGQVINGDYSRIRAHDRRLVKASRTAAHQVAA